MAPNVPNNKEISDEMTAMITVFPIAVQICFATFVFENKFSNKTNEKL